MNRRFIFLVGAVALLVVGGGLTSFIAANGGSGSLIPGVLTVTEIPEASVTKFGANQGFWLVALIAFIVFNLVGATLTGMAISWFLNREVARAKASEPANHETLRDAFAPKPRVTELPAEVES